jgi:adenylate kinase
MKRQLMRVDGRGVRVLHYRVNIVLLGPPGVGKGTQAERIAAALQIPHISSGQMFREAMGGDTPLARQLHSYVDRGEYVPDELTNALVLKRLQEPDTARGFILDGYPRTLTQAEALDTALEQEGRAIDLALDIEAPVAVLVRRIAGRRVGEHRADDSPEVIQTRLEEYRLRTQTVIDYYTGQGKLKEVDGSGSVDEVYVEIEKALNVPREGTAKQAV